MPTIDGAVEPSDASEGTGKGVCRVAIRSLRLQLTGRVAHITGDRVLCVCRADMIVDVRRRARTGRKQDLVPVQVCSPVSTACSVNGVVLRQSGGAPTVCPSTPLTRQSRGVRGIDLLQRSHGSY
jgi:hypothetical protein